MTDPATVIQAAAGCLTVVGGGFAWVWREIKRGRRKDDLRFKKIESDLEKCNVRERKANHLSSGLLTVIELLMQEVGRLMTISRETESAALVRAKQLMAKLKIEPPEDDPDLRDFADELDIRIGDRRHRRHGERW